MNRNDVKKKRKKETATAAIAATTKCNASKSVRVCFVSSSYSFRASGADRIRFSTRNNRMFPII